MSDVNGSALIPSLRYADAPAAIEWLVRVFGFSKHAVYPGEGDTIAHAQLTLGHGMVMLGSASNASLMAEYMATPAETGGKSGTPVYVVVPDCEPVYAAAKAAGAKILMEMETMDYGGQAFTLSDPEGYVWSVGEYDPWAEVKG